MGQNERLNDLKNRPCRTCDRLCRLPTWNRKTQGGVRHAIASSWRIKSIRDE